MLPTQTYSSISKTHTSSKAHHSPFVPNLDAEELAELKTGCLDELEAMHRLGHLRPAGGK